MNIKEIALDTSLKKSGRSAAIPTTQVKNAWSWITPGKTKYHTSKLLPGYHIYFSQNYLSPGIKRVFLADPKDMKLPAVEIVLHKYGNKGWISAATQVMEKYQGSGLGLKLYEALIKDFSLILVSDTIQSLGGAKLWRRLFDVPGIDVYAYNPTAREDKYKYVSVDGFDDLGQLNTVYGPELYGDTKKDVEAKKKVIRLVAIKDH
jgi:hypothetical protein